MKPSCKALALVGWLLVAGYLIAASSTKKEARVTRIVRDVKVLPADAPAISAELNQLIKENSGVRTGDESRSELTFADLTITRLGANTIFSFNRAGRMAELDSGQMLLRVPKDSGGATIKASAVTVGITGTTVIYEGDSAGAGKLMVLEGRARMRLNAYPTQSKYVWAGQMLAVDAGATTLPDPVAVSLKDIMQTNPLITDFPPLPSQKLITAAINNQGSNNGTAYRPNPVVGAPVKGQPVATQAGPVVGNPVGYVPPGGNIPVRLHPPRHGKTTPTPHANYPTSYRPKPGKAYQTPTPSPGSKTRRPTYRRVPGRATSPSPIH